MKKMLFVSIVLIAIISCTKHDPFDDPGLWILSRFESVDYQDPDGSRCFSHQSWANTDSLNTPFPAGDGRYHRVPTSGELQMIFPYASPDLLSQYNLKVPLQFSWVPTSDRLLTFIETAYLENNDDYSADKSGETISGESVFYYDEEFDDGDPDYFPIYALRFKGTTQYAAYRYSVSVEGEGNYIKTVLTLKAKWLRENDVTTTIDDIKDPAYWESGYLELKFYPNQYMLPEGYLYEDVLYLMSSTLDGYPVVGMYAYSESGITTCYEGDKWKYAIRMIRCKSDGTL